MKLFFTFLISLIFLSFTNAQEIKGIWRGTFEQKDFNPMFGSFTTSTYKYEVQVNQLNTKALEGVTYSYLNTSFYGKASLKGMYQPKGKTLVIKETSMLDMRSEQPTEPCLMTCYLDYKKDGELETLTGTYISINVKTNKDCGSGTVYLERVTTTKFEKEAFLSKTPIKKTIPKSNTLVKPSKPNPNFIDNPINKNSTTEKKQTQATPNSNKSKNINISTQKNTTKPGTQEFMVKKDSLRKKEEIEISSKPKNQPIINQLPKQLLENKTDATIKEIETPKILVDRENKLNSNIQVDEKEILLEFYDNGEIDDDLISVYKNNEKLIDNQKLGLKPLTIKLLFDEEHKTFEIITVAETLGRIPPNTALMVVTYGLKRQEILLTSDNNTNAKIIIEYTGAKRIK